MENQIHLKSIRNVQQGNPFSRRATTVINKETMKPINALKPLVEDDESNVSSFIVCSRKLLIIINYVGNLIT